MFVHVYVVCVMLQRTWCNSAKAVNFFNLLNKATLSGLLSSALFWSGLGWSVVAWARFKPGSKYATCLCVRVCVSYLGNKLSSVCVCAFDVRRIQVVYVSWAECRSNLDGCVGGTWVWRVPH